MLLHKVDSDEGETGAAAWMRLRRRAMRIPVGDVSQAQGTAGTVALRQQMH